MKDPQRDGNDGMAQKERGSGGNLLPSDTPSPPVLEKDGHRHSGAPATTEGNFSVEIVGEWCGR